MGYGLLNPTSFSTICLLPTQGQPNAKVFGAPLESLIKGDQKIPLVVEKLISTIEMHGLFTEGLYRKSGAAPKARELKLSIETGIVELLQNR